MRSLFAGRFGFRAGDGNRRHRVELFVSESRGFELKVGGNGLYWTDEDNEVF